MVTQLNNENKNVDQTEGEVVMESKTVFHIALYVSFIVASIVLIERIVKTRSQPMMAEQMMQGPMGEEKGLDWRVVLLVGCIYVVLYGMVGKVNIPIIEKILTGEIFASDIFKPEMYWNTMENIFVKNDMMYFKKFRNVFLSRDEVDDKVDESNNLPTPSIFERKKDVFLVNDDLYNYDDAKAVCRSFGAKLATSTQMNKAYEDGKNWCELGWAKGQYVLFPAQKDYTDRNKECGKEGVNGYYEIDSKQQYAANCYGIKK